MIINNHKNFRDRLSIDYQYQSINWYPLLSIVIDCHQLSISSIVQVLKKTCLWQTWSRAETQKLNATYRPRNKLTLPACEKSFPAPEQWQSNSIHNHSLLRRDLFVLWGGWGEIKRECAGHDGKGEERRETSRLFPLPIVHHALSIFLIIAIFIAHTQREPLRKKRAIIKR